MGRGASPRITFARAVCALGLAACGSNGGAGDAGVHRNDCCTVDAAAVIEDVHLYGRWDASSAAAWPGAAIAARFSGPSLSVSLEDAGDDWLEVTIDGATRPPIHATGGSHVYSVASGLAAGDHDVVLAKRSESFFGKVRFGGFPGATLVATPRLTRRIEMIGDSITAGYGVLGALPCTFTASTEAEPRAYGALAAQQLGAAHTAIAYSGIGMVRNNGGTTTDTMPERYGRTFADDPGSTWDWRDPPDVVVIGLGTNDFAQGDPGQGYVDAYATFVTSQVRAHAPGAQVLLATSSMMGGAERTQMRGYLDAVVTRLADPKVRVVDIPEQLAADGYGCDYHPNEITHHKMAAVLVPAIRAVTGW